jgi:hypothetical protein
MYSTTKGQRPAPVAMIGADPFLGDPTVYYHVRFGDGTYLAGTLANPHRVPATALSPERGLYATEADAVRQILTIRAQRPDQFGSLQWEVVDQQGRRIYSPPLPNLGS